MCASDSNLLGAIWLLSECMLPEEYLVVLRNELDFWDNQGSWSSINLAKLQTESQIFNLKDGSDII